MEIASPKLKIFYERGRLKFARGGRGSIKSWGWGQAIVIFMTNYNMRILCCREIQQSIKSSSYQLLVDTIERYGLTQDFEILKTEIRHKTTGALVVFVGLKSNPEAIKSYEGFDIAVVEEAENITDLSIKILHATIFRNKGAQVWYIWNPRYPTDPVEKLMSERQGRDGVFTEHFTYEDNPFWTEEMELERLEVLEVSQDQHDWVFGGQYLSEGSMRLFSYNLIKDSLALDAVDHRECKRILGVDVARMGADSTALVMRNGNKLSPFKSFKGFDTNQLERAIDDYIVEHSVDVVVIDCTGGHGTGLLDIMKKKYAPIGVEVIEYNSSYKANNGEYYNARAEVYDSAQKWVKNGGKVTNDDLFVEELQNIEYFYNKTTNQFQIEPKDVLKTRIGRSPDKMDAFTMTFFVSDERPKVNTASRSKGRKKTWRF
jgi:hypothetical protein